MIEYINKPISQGELRSVLEKAIHLKDEERKKLDAELALKEKMAYILPVLESGFIYSLIFSDDHTVEMESFRKILDISINGGYIMTIEFGDTKDEAGITNKIGTSVQSQKYYPLFRDAIKECCICIVGPVMLNRIITYIPCADTAADEYVQRMGALETASAILGELEKITDKMEFYIGIGKSYPDLLDIYKSYEESLKAIRHASESNIVHINDIPLESSYQRIFPEDLEKNLINKISDGNTESSLILFDQIFEWLRQKFGESPEDMKSSLIELAVLTGRVTKNYGVTDNSDGDYIREFLSLSDSSGVRAWMKNRIRKVCEGIAGVREKKLSSVIISAKSYIAEHFGNEITLEDVSQAVNVSPNYFSKLFKDETGSNFIDYLTELRIEKAKQILADGNTGNKEICYQIGYSDPNYFSRIFKKIVGVTPTEYRASHSKG